MSRSILRIFGLHMGILNIFAKLEKNKYYEEFFNFILLNERGEPIPFAYVQVKGTNRGVTTDWDGSACIDVYPGETLVISAIGYESIEVVYSEHTQSAVFLFICLHGCVTTQEFWLKLLRRDRNSVKLPRFMPRRKRMPSKSCVVAGTETSVFPETISCPQRCHVDRPTGVEILQRRRR